MPIALNSKLSSTVANATWLDKTQDDATVGKISLNNIDAVSGASISNAQREINKSSKVVNASTSYLDGDDITLNTISLLQVFRLVGNAAPVTLTSLLFSNQPLDGTELILIGQDDTNTVTINLNDVQFGQYINGTATLKRGYVLRLIYDAGLERFIEISRSF